MPSDPAISPNTLSAKVARLLKQVWPANHASTYQALPQHLIQRGNNRMPCFLDDNDKRRYLHLLHETLRDTGNQLHAYVLMDNHVHLLVTPAAIGAVSRLMQQLGRQYVGQFNARHRRTGTLWEGRYKSCLVDSETYVLRRLRYIDLNPIRACMTDDPTTFP